MMCQVVIVFVVGEIIFVVARPLFNHHGGYLVRRRHPDVSMENYSFTFGMIHLNSFSYLKWCVIVGNKSTQKWRMKLKSMLSTL